MSRVRVLDGDTVTHPDHGRVRLAGIDAPELGQPARDAAGRHFDAGRTASEALAAHLRARQRAGWRLRLRIEPGSRDRHRRRIGVLLLLRRGECEDVCAWLVRQGWAAAEYPPPDYRQEERLAQAAGAGLWAGEWQRPRRFRAGGRGRAFRPGRARRRGAPGSGLLALARILARLLGGRPGRRR